MSNVEWVRRSIELWNQGDFEAVFANADPEIEWHDQQDLPGASIHRGAEAAEENIRSVLHDLVGHRMDAEELVDAGTHVVVCGRVSGRGRASGVPVHRALFVTDAFRAGRIRSVRIFGTRAEALEAAGLVE